MIAKLFERTPFRSRPAGCPDPIPVVKVCPAAGRIFGLVLGLAAWSVATPVQASVGLAVEPALAAEEAPAGAGETPKAEEGAEGAPADDAPSEAPAAEESGAQPAEEATPEGPQDQPPEYASSKDAGQAVSGQATETKEGDITAVGKTKKKPKGLTHHKTGQISVAGGWGFNMVVPYADDIFCGEFSTDDGDPDGRKSICTAANPWFLDLSAGYGAHPRLDVLFNFRLNLQSREFKCKDANDPESCTGLYNSKLGYMLGPGIRAWISKPEKLFKVGAAVDFLYEFEDFSGYRNRPRCSGPEDGCRFAEGPIEAAEDDVGDHDFSLRLGPVFQFDVHHNIGIFLQPYARMSFVRWFEFSFDVNLGLQARFP